MNAKILDQRSDDVGTCYLCSIALSDYLSALPTTYQDYEIQREIVSNVYLDHLVDTVLNRRHIPPIVLVAREQDAAVRGDIIKLKAFKILDGLQRTYRLQAIHKTVNFCETELSGAEDYTAWNKFKLSRAFSEELRKFDSNTEILSAILKRRAQFPDQPIAAAFTDNRQWFEVWTGLSAEDEVSKMLTLNAGHKPVKTRHQLELLFLNLLPMLEERGTRGFNLVREKETSATQFSKGRQVGDFHFAHVVTALLSLAKAKPIAPSTSLIQRLQDNEQSIDGMDEFTEPSFLQAFVQFLVELDRIISRAYPQIGVFWMGREITLAGLLGGIGMASRESGKAPRVLMEQLVGILNAKPNILNLEDFEEQRNSVDLSKVNIGNVNRAAVCSGVLEILRTKPGARISWRRHFHPEVE